MQTKEGSEVSVRSKQGVEYKRNNFLVKRSTNQREHSGISIRIKKLLTQHQLQVLQRKVQQPQDLHGQSECPRNTRIMDFIN